MSLGQSILAAAALIMLTILVISANRMIVQSQEDEYKAIAVNEASEIANAIINEALSKQYDANSSTSSYQSASVFTDASSLGPNSTESSNVPTPDTSLIPYSSSFRSIKYYNDFDDYHLYERKVNTRTLIGYVAKCKVTYVRSDNFNLPTTTKGFFKRIVVTVEQSVYLPPINGVPQISFSAVKTY